MEILDVGTKQKLGDKAKEDIGSKARKITQGNLKNSQDSTSDEDELGSVPEQITKPLENEQVEVFALVNRFPDIEAIGEEAEYEDNAVARTSEPDLVVCSERTSSESEVGFESGGNTVTVIYCERDEDCEE